MFVRRPLSCRSCCKIAMLLSVLTLVVRPSVAQTELATVLGRVTDQTGAVLTGVSVEIRNVDTNVAVTSSTNAEGLYTIRSLRPGRYVISIHKQGFKTVSVTGVELNVQDNVVRNFVLQVGSVSESITVRADAQKINTIDASVSTVVDRSFAENLPMNGRSFQTLIQLTPGVVLTQSTPQDSGQFSVNGQRADSNYWTVDGVSANVGVSALKSPGNGFAGTLGAFSAQGGTNSLVSVDAMQEFRIQTSTYAPEFGRTPGGQISIVTRSGNNAFHGTLFDYLRNDVFDANDWFADQKGLAKPEERQNDFGGTFSGPILKNRTFFFFSYEGLRLRLPQVRQTIVPDVAARQNALPALQPFLKAYPLPNGPEVLDAKGNPTGSAQFNSSFSNASSLDAYSLRVDHKLRDKLDIFGRYNYSPSSVTQRGSSGLFALSTLAPAQITMQTATVGGVWAMSRMSTNDFRFNYSRTNAISTFEMDNFGGAVPLTSVPNPAPFTTADSIFTFSIFPLAGMGGIAAGLNQNALQRQINLVDSISLQKSTHALKFGVDFRRLSPEFNPISYQQAVFFLNVPSAEAGHGLFDSIAADARTTLLLRNLGVFAQDTWRIVPRLTLTYGLRWDVDVAPAAIDGPSVPAATGFNLSNLSQLALAPAGTPPFNTTYGNVAPRIGVAYQIITNQNWQTVLRGGFGVFYDLATDQVGNFFLGSYPFGASRLDFGSTFPLSTTVATAPAITPASLKTGTFTAFDPNLQLPYTRQWNVALEQGLGKQQSLSISYIGAAGERLIQSATVTKPNATFGKATLVSNTANSNYQAMQVQLNRRLSRGLQALVSYSWSHSIDDGSTGSWANSGNTLVPSLDPNVNRGPSDFDVRHSFSAGLTYAVPSIDHGWFIHTITREWSLQNTVQARSAPPVNAFYSGFNTLFNGFAEVRPDLVPGQSLYLSGPQFPGGMALNPAAFTPPPVNAAGQPLRQGDLGRNALRGFGAFQWDLAVHRDIRLREPLTLQFRAEMFNVLNHPNFGPPISDRTNQAQFGQSTQMLGRSLVGGLNSSGGGAFDPLYQIGGPRSIQMALRLSF